MPRKQVIHPGDMYPTAGYARAVRTGNTIYIAGTIAKNDQNEIVGIGDVERQARQVFENIGRILKAAGATFDDMVKMNIYAIRAEDRMTILNVRDRYVKREGYVSTYIVPRALAAPELLVEIEAVAVVED
ncbi:MAG: RidA family protein [Armatimonadetes bacterium]|nr:RidA family protein [Armatimonadota bacterium]